MSNRTISAEPISHYGDIGCDQLSRGTNGISKIRSAMSGRSTAKFGESMISMAIGSVPAFH